MTEIDIFSKVIFIIHPNVFLLIYLYSLMKDSHLDSILLIEIFVMIIKFLHF